MPYYVLTILCRRIYNAAEFKRVVAITRHYDCYFNTYNMTYCSNVVSVDTL